MADFSHFLLRKTTKIDSTHKGCGGIEKNRRKELGGDEKEKRC